MKVKTGNDEFCLFCMEWQKYDEKCRCRVCKHVIHKENKKSEKEGYNKLKSESPSFEFDIDEDIYDSDY